jgi:hypothetical protein
MPLSGQLENRLDAIRGGAPRRSPTVRALAAFATHTDCGLANLGFAAGVDFDRLLQGTGYALPFGQSPFALSRGLSFEKLLRADNYSVTRELLRGVIGVAPAAVRVRNLREGYPKGPTRMPLRSADTEKLLRLMLRGDSTAPHLIDGAVLTAAVGGLPAFFEADAVAARGTDSLRVAEVKSFPKVDDRVDPDKLGAALDQVALYILFLRDAIARLGGDPECFVSDRALLITPRNVGLAPTLSEQCVATRIARSLMLLDKVPSAADVAASVPAGTSFAPVADTAADESRRVHALHVLADTAGTAYGPACLSNCGNARFCRERAFRAGSPCLSGPTAVRLLPGVPTLDRAEELTRGAAPSAAEAPVADLLSRAGRLYDATATPVPDMRPV